MKRAIFTRLFLFLEDTSNRTMLLALALILLTLAAYYPLRKNEFVNYDDPAYIYNNHRVVKGLTLENVAWSFKTTALTNWHPVTWLSHMADVQFFGLRVSGHHATSFVLHLANVLLLFLVLYQMTSQVWPSSFVAAVFAIHPLNVESVAWVSERKNVLSTLFLLLTIWAYIRYARRPGWRQYLLVIGFFVVGLMTKPMIVTLPFLLLLLDFWPLGRVEAVDVTNSLWRRAGGLFRNDPAQADLPSEERRKALLRLGLEKLPLLALSFVSCLITLKASASGGAMMSTQELTIGNRLSNTVTSYVNYLCQMVWPAGLTAFYPHPGSSISYRQVLAASLVMVATTILVAWRNKSSGYLAVGWLWYLGTLLPVIGLVQVGTQARADRYAYVPMIGVLIIAAWGVGDWTRRWRHRNYWVSGIVIFVLVALTMITRQQVRYWQNGNTLWTHALAVTKDNYVAHTNLAIMLVALGRYDEAIDHCNSALLIVPGDGLTYETLGEALSKKGQPNEGIPYLYKALRLTDERETAISAQRALGEAMVKVGNDEKAIHHFSQALRLDPQIAEVHATLADLFYKTKQFDRARLHYLWAVRIAPNFSNYLKLASFFKEHGTLQEAVAGYRHALSLEPDSVEAQRGLASLEKIGLDNPPVPR